jgi:uncharacterized membrane protein
VITYREEATIERSADEVWAYAADITRHPEWMGVLDAEVITGRPTDVGAMGRQTVRIGPRRYAAEFVVSASDPGRHIAWRVAGGVPFTGEVRLELEPIGSTRTRAVYSGAVRLTGFWRLLEPLMAREVRAGGAAELQRLKGVLEAATGAVAATA